MNRGSLDVWDFFGWCLDKVFWRVCLCFCEVLLLLLGVCFRFWFFVVVLVGGGCAGFLKIFVLLCFLSIKTMPRCPSNVASELKLVSIFSHQSWWQGVPEKFIDSSKAF